MIFGTLSDIFRVATLVFVILFGYSILRFERKSFRKHLFLLFLVSLCSYLLAYWENLLGSGVGFQIAFFLSVQLPLTFWLMARALFQDEFEWSNRYWILIFLVPPLHYLIYRMNEFENGFPGDDFRFLPYLISVTFIALAIFEAVKNRKDDLLISRFKKRNIFVLFSSIFALLSIYFYFTHDPYRLPEIFELIQNLYFCLFLLWFFGSLFTYRGLFQGSEKTPKDSVPQKDPTRQKALITKILEAFTEDQLFMEEGLTITQLATKTGEKEYLIRRAINGELGYTNFNSFLNYYRVEEARKLIQEDPLLNFQEIAFRLGYQSVATFNRAFKKETGQTPTEFRASI